MADKSVKEKILDKLEGKLDVKLGECPFCNTDDYSRHTQDWVDDFCCVKCTCNECNRDFTEYFGLDEVKFDKEDENFIYNNSLYGDEKEIIKEWAEEQLEFGSPTEEYKNKLLRIFNVMDGSLNED